MVSPPHRQQLPCAEMCFRQQPATCSVLEDGEGRETPGEHHAAAVSVNNPVLNSSGLQVSSRDKPSHAFSPVADHLLSKCLNPLLKTLGSRQPALQRTHHAWVLSQWVRSLKSLVCHCVSAPCLPWWADVVQRQRGTCTTVEQSRGLTCEAQAHDEKVTCHGSHLQHWLCPLVVVLAAGFLGWK